MRKKIYHDILDVPHASLMEILAKFNYKYKVFWLAKDNGIQCTSSSCLSMYFSPFISSELTLNILILGEVE